jgi:hypothetical protein
MAKTITIGKERKDGKFPVVYCYKGAPNMFGGFDSSMTYRKLHTVERIQTHTLGPDDTLVNNSARPNTHFFNTKV